MGPDGLSPALPVPRPIRWISSLYRGSLQKVDPRLRQQPHHTIGAIPAPFVEPSKCVVLIAQLHVRVCNLVCAYVPSAAYFFQLDQQLLLSGDRLWPRVHEPSSLLT